MNACERGQVQLKVLAARSDPLDLMSVARPPKGAKRRYPEIC